MQCERRFYDDKVLNDSGDWPGGSDEVGSLKQFEIRV